MMPSTSREEPLDLTFFTETQNLDRRDLCRVPHGDSGDEMDDTEDETTLMPVIKLEKKMGSGDEMKCDDDRNMISAMMVNQEMIEECDLPDNTKCVDLNHNYNGKVIMDGDGVKDINDNYNGKVMVDGVRDINDNRQHQEQPQIRQQEQVMANGEAWKNLKRVTIPFNITGLEMSGSGTELYVKTQRTTTKHSQAKAGQPLTATPPIKKKKIGRPKKGIGRQMESREGSVLDEAKTVTDQDMSSNRTDLMSDVPRTEQRGYQPMQILGYVMRPMDLESNDKKLQASQFVEIQQQEEKMDNSQDLRQHYIGLDQEKGPCPYVYSQNPQPCSPKLQANNVIAGPSWKEDNGLIDVRSQHASLSMTNPQLPQNSFETPLEHKMSTFRHELKAKYPSLKRRLSSPPPDKHRDLKQKGYNKPRHQTSSDNAVNGEYDEDDVVEYKGNLHRLSNADRRESKVLPKDNNKLKNKPNRAFEQQMPSSSVFQKMSDASSDIDDDDDDDESVINTSTLPNMLSDTERQESMDSRNVSKKMENQFPANFADVEGPQILEFGRDLKTIYRDLRKVVRNFETVYYQRNNNETEVTEEQAINKDRRCSIM